MPYPIAAARGGAGERRGGAIDYFWCYSPALKNQALLQVSCFGDSITKGSYNVAKQSRIAPPEAAASIVGLDTSRTITTGSELFQSVAHALSAGAAESEGVFTLTASVGDPNPRFAINPSTVANMPAVSAGELYLVRAEIDTTGSVGKHLALRVMTYAAAVQAGTDTNVCGDSVDNGDYLPVSYVVSVDYFKTVQATFNRLNVGGEIVATETAGVGLIRDVELYKLSSGVAVVNQGVDGDDTIEGLARIATVTGWTPDVVVVAFGTNDIREHNNLTTFTDNLTSIINAVKAAGGYPVLATIPPLAADQANYDDVPAWNAAIEALAASAQVGFWDRWKALNNGDLTLIDDGRHPTRAGYLMLGADLANKVRYGG